MESGREFPGLNGDADSTLFGDSCACGGGAFNGSARVHAFVDLPGDRALMSVIIKRLTYRMMIVIIA
jgi:hypothetical protein